MLPYANNPYASGNYLSQQAMLGYNYPFSTPNPDLSPWRSGTGIVAYQPDVYSPATVTEIPPPHYRKPGLMDWLSTLDVVDGTLILAGIGLTVLFVVGMVVELVKDAVRLWERNERRKQGNFFQRLFRRSPRP
jgi:hypothetical protein